MQKQRIDLGFYPAKIVMNSATSETCNALATVNPTNNNNPIKCLQHHNPNQKKKKKEIVNLLTREIAALTSKH